MFISVIIPTRNRSHLLKEALTSIEQQNYSPYGFEVIVVDNGSFDDTKIICESFNNRFNRFQYIYEDTPGLHAGRHAGFEMAQGEILVYADNDIYAFPTWLEGISESFSDPRVALVGGKNLPDFEISPPDWVNSLWREHNGCKSIPLFSVMDCGDQVQEISPFFVWGCNFSIRKSVLQSVGGFHPDGMPGNFLRYRGDGETAVSRAVQQLNYTAVYNPKASVYHRVSADRMTYSYVYKRAYAQGISDSYTRIRSKGVVLDFEYGYLSLIARRLIRRIKENFAAKNDPIARIYEDGYRAGYKFHQKEVKRDPELLKWVLQKHYIRNLNYG